MFSGGIEKDSAMKCMNVLKLSKLTMKALKNEFNLYVFNVNFFMPSEKIRFSYIFRRCRKEALGKTGILTVF